MIREISLLKKRDILKVRFDLIYYNNVVEAIERWRQNNKRHYITLTPPHSVLMCHRSEQMRQATAGADLTLPDGIGIILAAQVLGFPHKGRVTGPMLMLKICDWGRRYGYRHYFYGGKEGVAKKLAKCLSEKLPGIQIAGTYSPPFRVLDDDEDEKVIEMINSYEPDIVWVGLGAPKQEKWMASHISKIAATAMIGVGAAFDFHSGNIVWAPASVRKLGLEWAYRLSKEPTRLLRRNLDSPLFLAKIVQQRLSKSVYNKTEIISSPQKD